MFLRNRSFSLAVMSSPNPVKYLYAVSRHEGYPTVMLNTRLRLNLSHVSQPRRPKTPTTQSIVYDWTNMHTP